MDLSRLTWDGSTRDTYDHSGEGKVGVGNPTVVTANWCEGLLEVGGTHTPQLLKACYREISKKVSEAFANRCEEMALFFPLSQDDLFAFLQTEFRRLLRNLLQRADAVTKDIRFTPALLGAIWVTHLWYVAMLNMAVWVPLRGVSWIPVGTLYKLYSKPTCITSKSHLSTNCQRVLQ